MMTKKIAVIILLVICTALGAFLRLYRLTEVPAGLLQDEAAAGYDAYCLLKTGKDHHGEKWPVTFQTFNDWTGHSFNYQLIPFVKLFGLNTFSIRFAVAFLSILTIPLIYLLGKELTGKEEVSLLMAFLFSLSQFSVMNSRWAVQPNTVVFFFTLSLYLFLAGMNKNNTSNTRVLPLGDSKLRYISVWKAFPRVTRLLLWSASAIMFGLSLYTYPSVEGFLPVWLFGSMVIIFVMRKKLGGERRAKDMVFFTVVFLTVALPLFLDHIKRPETITTKLGMVSVLSQAEGGNLLISYLQNYLSYYLPNYLFLGKEVNPTRAVPGYGYENAFLGAFYYLGIFLLIFKKDELKEVFPLLDREKTHLLSWFLMFFPAVPSLTVPAGDFQRAIYITPVLMFLASMGAVYFLEKLRTIRFYSLDKYTMIIGLAILSFYLCFQYGFYNAYFGPKFRAYSEWYMQYGLEEVVGFTAENEDKYKSIVIDKTINQPYIYVLFYQKVDPAKLDYRDFADVDAKTNWLSVKKYKSYEFRKIEKEDVWDARLVKSIYNSPFSEYRIFEKGSNLIVKFEAVEPKKN